MYSIDGDRARNRRWGLLASASLLTTAAGLVSADPALAVCEGVDGSIFSSVVVNGAVGCVHWSGGGLDVINTGSVSGGTVGGGVHTGIYAGVIASASPSSLLNDGTIFASVSTITSSGTVVGGVWNAGGNIGTISNSAGISASGVIGSSAGFGNVIAAIGNSGSAGKIGTLSNSGTISASGAISVSSTVPAGSVQNVLAGVANMDGTISNLSNTGLITLSVSGGGDQSAIGAIVNRGVIETLTNKTGGRLVSQASGSSVGAGVFNADVGTIGSLENEAGATISGYNGVWNRGVITELTNSGTILSSESKAVLTDAGSTIVSFYNTSTGVVSSTSSYSSGIYHGGTIGTLTNAGLISGGYAGLSVLDTGTIGTLNNSGTITGEYFGIIDDGSIGVINNSGTIQSANLAILSENVSSSAVAALNNSGLIAGNIQNDRASNLTITGGTGTIVGTLTGSSGGIGSLDKGTITNTASDLVFASGNILLNDNVNVNGHKLINSANLALLNPVTVTGTIQQLSGTISGAALTSTAAFLMQSGSVSSVLAGSVALTKSTTGTLTLSGANTYTGLTSVTAGVLAISNGAALGTTGQGTSVTSGATLRLSGGIAVGAEALSLSGSGASGATGALQSVSGTNSYAGTITLGATSTIAVDAGSLSLTGSLSSSSTLNVAGAGSLILAGYASATQTNIASGSTLEIGAGGTTGALSGSINNSGSLVFNRSDDQGYSTAISGSGTLIKKGAGTLTLSGSSTYTGGTTISAGTLQIGNGSTLGSITGSITNNGTLAFNRSITTTYSSVISGSGSLTKLAAGALYLTGENTYTGVTTVSAGTLYVGQGGTTGSIAGDVVNNSALAFYRSNALTYGGSISGTGQVGVGGGGTITLTGDSTHTGGTWIAVSTLQIGDGGTTGSVTGDIATEYGGVAGALAFNRSDDLTYAGVISGRGTLTKKGAGVLTLTGASTLTGGTTISAGALQIGNGGTTGSLSGAIANNGTLVFNRSNAVAAGNITGSGTLIQRGTGTTTLSGTNSASSTTVEAGTLALRTGAELSSNVTVQSGATLAGVKTGSGTALVNGTVTVANGGHISASQVGGSDYGLSMTGLVLNSTSNVDVALGANLGTAAFYAGTLTLDGTLNVTNTGGMTFGVYRIMDYGTLVTDNGLELGSLPMGFEAVIQTSVANQINLVVDTTSLFWNGTSTTGDGTIHGGSGTWSTGGSTNWTDASGADDGAWSGGVAIFQGTPGTVTVDTSGGAVNVSAVQFAVDGYEVTGDTLTLTGSGQTAVRVGDGTSAGASYIATISSVLAGTSGLDKQDLGTLVLTGTNTYTGGTTVTAGTLQLGDGVTTGSIVGNVVNNSNLVFNPAAALTYSGVISGTGSLFKQGSGTLTLTGTNTYTGGTSITGGRLIISGGSSLSDTDGLIIGSAGTLELLDANETVGWLSGAGTIALNANCLTVAGGGTTFSGSINGSGCLSKTGTDTLTLSGINTYSGGTTISGGALRVTTTAALGSGDLALVGSATLQASGTFTYGGAVSLTPAGGAGGGTFLVDDTQTLTLSGVVSGAGALAKTGTGTLVLSGTNTYSGATNIDAGTLAVTGGQAIGDASTVNVATGAAFNVQGNETIGALAGSGSVVLAGSSLTLGGSNLSTAYSGILSGTGSLNKTGTGTLALTGANTYSGGTTVTAGTLSLGTSTAAGTGQISMLDGTTLAYADGIDVANALDISGAVEFSVASGSAVQSGVLTGSGSYLISGAGSLKLTSTSSFSGSTTIDGTLSVNGVLGGTVTVNDGGTLKGNGTVGDVTVLSGGTAAPGNSIGTLSVAGNITFYAGSIYEVEVDSSGASDLIAATGTATINGGTVEVLAATGSYSPATVYTILTASGGVSGTFTTVTSDLAFLIPHLTYGATSVTLNFDVTSAGLVSAAQTRNQRNTALAIEAGGTGSALYSSVIGQSTSGAVEAFNALSGESYASVRSALFDDGRMISHTLLGRLQQAGQGNATPSGTGSDAVSRYAEISGLTVWSEYLDGRSRLDGDGNAASVRHDRSGFLVGGEGQIGDDWRLGFAGGYSSSSFSVPDRASSADIDLYTLGMYAGRSLGPVNVRLGAAYSWGDIDMSRRVVYPGVDDSLSSSYDARMAQVFGEVGYDMHWDAFTFEPFANLTYLNLDTGKAREKGGASALDISGSQSDVTYTTLGLRTSAAWALEDGSSLVPSMMVGWQHAFGDTDPSASVGFDATGAGFDVFGAPLARDAALLEVGIDWKASENFKLGVSYRGTFANDLEDNAVAAKLQLKF